jgi:hypothetical protein
MHASESGAYSLFGFLIFNEERCGSPIRLLTHVMVSAHRLSATEANQRQDWGEVPQIQPQMEDAHLRVSKPVRRFNRGREVDALLEKAVASVRSGIASSCAWVGSNKIPLPVKEKSGLRRVPVGLHIRKEMPGSPPAWKSDPRRALDEDKVLGNKVGWAVLPATSWPAWMAALGAGRQDELPMSLALNSVPAAAICSSCEARMNIGASATRKSI